MGRLVAVVSIALHAMACATPKPPAHAGRAEREAPALATQTACGAVAPEAGHSLAVSLSITRGSDERKQPLCPGQALTADDALWINIALQTEAHVRLVFIAPDGQAGELLHQDESELTRSALFRAPRGLLSHAQGEAQLFLIASQRPLAESDESMQLMLDLIRDTGTLVHRDGSLHPPVVRSAPPPDIMQLDTSDKLFADFDDNGMAMLAISLRAGL